MRVKNRRLQAAAALGALALLSIGAVPGHAQTLYDATLGTAPASQGWLFFGNANKNGVGSTATQTVNGTNYVTLDSTADSNIYAGYTNYNESVAFTSSVITPTTYVNSSFPTLDHTLGYTINFSMQLTSESHSNAARAGFSLVAISSDKTGVEIGFHSSDLYSLATGFTVAESNGTDLISSLTGKMTDYSLQVKDNSYILYGDGQQLLKGTLKDYTSASGFGTDVYKTPNFLFLGDDTSSANGSENIKSISVVAASAPEPASIALFGMCGLAVFVRRRRK